MINKVLNKLTPPLGSTKRKKRLGRGPAKKGKTSGKGHKGQLSRSGGKVSIWFEGGQTPLKLRSVKRGFNNRNKRRFDVINIKDLNLFSDIREVNPEDIIRIGLVKGKNPIKVLGEGELERPLSIRAHCFSKTAVSKIEKQGGKAVLI